MSLAALAVAIRSMTAAQREAEAYDHASHGCPFFDAGAVRSENIPCPVCESRLANYREAQGAGDLSTEEAA